MEAVHTVLHHIQGGRVATWVVAHKVVGEKQEKKQAGEDAGALSAVSHGI